MCVCVGMWWGVGHGHTSRCRAIVKYDIVYSFCVRVAPSLNVAHLQLRMTTVSGFLSCRAHIQQQACTSCICATSKKRQCAVCLCVCASVYISLSLSFAHVFDFEGRGGVQLVCVGVRALCVRVCCTTLKRCMFVIARTTQYAAFVCAYVWHYPCATRMCAITQNTAVCVRVPSICQKDVIFTRQWSMKQYCGLFLCLSWVKGA